MRRGFGWVAAGLLALSGCGDRPGMDIAARAGDYELSADRLAELLATGKGLPLEIEVAEGVAALWADYTIFADRLLAGDSLIDSGYVTAAMWAEIQQELADRYHQKLVADQVTLDSGAVDSVYAAGELRWIRQVLFAVGPNVEPGVREARRREAAGTYERLTSGALTWRAAAAESDAANPRDSLGSLGLIGRGETIPPFENAAWALAPDSMSGVIESSEGFHILWRPRLAEVRSAFTDELQLRRELDFDDAFLAGLPERWDIEVRRGVGPAVREIGSDALRAKRSGKVLGSFRGGRFRVSDLARWLQAMPLQVRQQLSAASDSQVVMLVTNLMRNEALIREAHEAGVTLTPEFHEEMTDQLRRQLALVSALVGLPFDTLQALRSLPPEARRDTVTVRVFAYLDAVAQNNKRLQAVPPFLADTLRAETDWAIEAAGIERALIRAREIRLSMNPNPANQAAPAPTPAPPDAR